MTVIVMHLLQADRVDVVVLPLRSVPCCGFVVLGGWRWRCRRGRSDWQFRKTSCHDLG